MPPWADVALATLLRVELLARLELVERDPTARAAVVVTRVPLLEE